MSPFKSQSDVREALVEHERKLREADRTTVAMAANEVVQRFGSANAEYVKGYTGVDQETGQRLAKGLAGISKSKVNENPAYANQNIRQQAGFSAEVATTSRDNAEAVIKRSRVRTSRSDDLPQYGANHNVVDRVRILDGKVVDGSQAQMKFVGNRDQLLDSIAREKGEFARYRGVLLELPSEQFQGDRSHLLEQAKQLRARAQALGVDSEQSEHVKGLLKKADLLERRGSSPSFQPQSAADYCLEQAAQRRTNALKVEANGNLQVAQTLNEEAENYERLAENVRDSGLTTQEAIFYREHPKIATLLDIGRTSHHAGLEGARIGAALGVSISLLSNFFKVAQGEKNLADVFKDVSKDALKAGAVGYATSFTGAAIKGGMQQAQGKYVRQLATTGVPALVMDICVSLGASVKRYVSGEINEAQFLSEVGEKGSGMLSASMMAAVGQIAIPIPIVGAAIGSMIGCTLSSIFYQSALEAARDLERSRTHLSRVRLAEEAARERITLERESLVAFMGREIPQLQKETIQFVSLIGSVSETGVDAIAVAVNHYATLLGKQIQFESQAEFNDFMASDKPLVL
ncbi:MAG: hypothetical protein LKF64_09535 [Alcaligenes faecalis]|nr:hypothetical protein [Alcaligenes faecalis]